MSDHEGDGGWPFRDVKRERKEIQQIRKIVPSEGQSVIDLAKGCDCEEYPGQHQGSCY